jgi:HSP20 family protein
MMVRRSEQPTFQRLRDEMDRLLWNFYRPGEAAQGAMVSTQGSPPVNVWEQNDTLYVEAELPGVKSENLDISVVNNELTIKGQRPDEKEAETAYHRRERGLGAFVRVLRLPMEVDSAQVKATLTDGVLLIALPKTEAAKPRKIQVKAS